VSIKNDGHYFCRAGGNRPDGLNEPVTVILNISVINVFDNHYHFWWVLSGDPTGYGAATSRVFAIYENF
ncbi:hypothetical protein, partial [Escherichia coli]|uniref:hypothetical protein n=1 Tax=Escherichia coli TaxID=562 RepID=UPI0023425D4E